MFFLILSGSSSHMIHDVFLNPTSALYGRAIKLMKLEPLSYESFCKACGLKPSSENAFIQFSLMGGIPKYWEFIEKKQSCISTAEKLYFGFSPYMENEPRRILNDEKVYGLSPINLLEVIGRGAEKPSEMAARLQVPQTNLSKTLQQLLDASVLTREVPFGFSEKDAKKTLYKITEPSLRFWYRVYSPHRTLWSSYSAQMKNQLLRQHASTVFEDYCRKLYPNSMRYWDKNVEIDLVHVPIKSTIKSAKGHDVLVAEVKFKKLRIKETQSILNQLTQKWSLTPTSKKYSNPLFKILDVTNLKKKY